MNAPLFKFGLFGADTSLVVAFLIGVGFGFFLERAGFGSARKLVSQFYLNDLAVFKVMFTAIVTAMLGVTFLSWIGWLDLSLVYLTPTYLVPQIVGGLVLGFGFVIGGYCPGTSVAAVATGRIDGLVFVLGVVTGTLGFAEAYPLVRSFHGATFLGQTTIWQYFNLPYGLLVFGVVVMALGGFAGAGRVEKWMAGAAGPRAAGPGAPFRINRRLALGALVLGAVAIVARPTTGASVTVDARELAVMVQRGADRVQPGELADWIIAGRADYRLVDVRDEQAFAGYRVPGAENVPLGTLPSAGLPRNERLVLCSTDGSQAAQAWVLLRAHGYGTVYVLNGGIEGWTQQVVFPVLGDAATPAGQRANERLARVSAYFGGTPRAAAGGPATMPVQMATMVPKVAPPVPPAAGKKAATKKKEGC